MTIPKIHREEECPNHAALSALGLSRPGLRRRLHSPVFVGFRPRHVVKRLIELNRRAVRERPWSDFQDCFAHLQRPPRNCKLLAEMNDVRRDVAVVAIAPMGMLFSRWETLLIALALIVPESLRSYAHALEPYPAVILPAGAGTIHIDKGRVHVQRSYLSAMRHGDWEEVDTAKFLAPIAEHYFGRLAGRDFGLHKKNAAAVRETKRWMKAKLAAQGFETRYLRVMQQKMTITLVTGEQSPSKPHRKETYDLD